MLAANLFGCGTDGAVFSLDPHHNEVILERSYPLRTVDANELRDGLESLLQVVDIWLERFAEGVSLGANDADETTGEGGVAGIRV